MKHINLAQLALALVMTILLVSLFTCDDDDDDDDNDVTDDDIVDDDTTDDDTSDDDTSDDDTTDDDDDDDTIPTNYALDFDGADDYVVVPDNPSLNVTTAMTVEAWVNIEYWDPDDFHNIVSHYDSAAGWNLRINTGGRFKFETYDDGGYSALDSAQAPLDQWIHVAGTFDNGTIRLWVDGVKVAETTGAEVGQSTTNLFFGMRVTESFYFNGMIDEVRLSSVARYDANFTPAAELTSARCFAPSRRLSTLAVPRFTPGAWDPAGKRPSTCKTRAAEQAFV